MQSEAGVRRKGFIHLETVLGACHSYDCQCLQPARTRNEAHLRVASALLLDNQVNGVRGCCANKNQDEKSLGVEGL